MIVVTLLVSERQLARVTRATPTPHRIVQTTSALEARSLLRQQPADVLVVDPVVGSHVPRVASSASDLFSLGTEFPYLPVVFYASNAVNAVPLIARFPTRERCEAVVAGIDDDPHSIGMAIESVMSASFVGSMARRIAPAVVRAPSSLLRGVRNVLSSPAAFRTAKDLATHSCMARRTLDRWLEQCDMVTGAELIAVARAILAVRLLRDRLFAHDEIFAACGLSASHDLEEFISGVAGAALSQLVASNDDELLERFSKRLRRVRSADAAIPTNVRSG